MPTWIGWVLGALNVIQFVKQLIDSSKRSTYDRNVTAAKDSLVALRAMCTEAINSAEVIKTDSTKQFVRQIAYMALNIENTLTAIVPNVKK